MAQRFSTFRLATYAFASNGAKVNVFGNDVTTTPPAPSVNPVTQETETPILLADETITESSTAVSNIADKPATFGRV